jgi:aryl-alcohol dehydrogenase-like predicted oxidoreductase
MTDGHAIERLTCALRAWVCPMNSTSRLWDSARERLVLGTWGLAGTAEASGRVLGYGHLSDGAAFSVFDSAWQFGIRWVDTASGYGDGEGWRRLAAWHARTGCRFHIAVKVGRPIRNGKPTSDLRKANILFELQSVRDLLGTPEAVLIKDPPDDAFGPPLLDLLDQVSEVLPTVSVGIASHGRQVLDTLPLAQGHLLVEIDYNGTNWPAAAPSASRMKAKHWNVWAVQPLAYGFLGRKYHRTSSFPADDWRSQMPPRIKEILHDLSEGFLAQFSPFLDEVPPAACAIAFCLSDPNIDRVVVGPKTPGLLQDSSIALELAADPSFRSAADRLRSTVIPVL